MIQRANSRPIPATADHLASLLVGWPESAHGTLAQRLANAIRAAVAAGLIGDGVSLPAERALADALAVSRTTVTVALDQLRAEGIVESHRGSGSVVHSGQRSIASTRIGEHFSEWPGIDLAAGNPPDPSHWPAISISVADLIADGGGPGVQPLGLLSLRAALAARHSEAGRWTDVDQVHVTAGAHQAVALVVGSCVAPGEVLAVEDTSYPGIFDIIERLGARAVPVVTDAAGLVPAALENVLREHQPKVLYVQTGPHNPTGRAPAPGRLRALAPLLDRYDTVVVEDCALADLAFDGRVGPELADLCRRAVVTSVGSFSKVAWGGLRIGWLRAPAPMIERTMHLRLAIDLGASVPSQIIALRLLPHLADLAERRRQSLKASAVHAAERLRADFPTWTFNNPEGGSVLWVKLPLADSGPFVRLARRHGVHVAPGSVARADRAADPHIRICIDRPQEIVDAGLQRLGLAWREIELAPEPVLG